MEYRKPEMDIYELQPDDDIVTASVYEEDVTVPEVGKDIVAPDY